ncbi:hypothetical protein Avbf_05864 [Armadillidium vulgare]|nr:hypothetical protein Avbf_05864 [Armadillidium vulgare]
MIPYVDVNKESFIQFHRHLALSLIQVFWTYEVVKPEFNLSSKWISPTDRNLNYIVTIVIDLCSGVEVWSRTEDNVRLISQIRKQWEMMKIILATNQSGAKYQSFEKFQDDNVIEVLCDKWNAPVLKTVLRSIETPFTLILHEPLAVTPDLNITRLLNTIEEVKVVGVIGFAERGKDGGWDYTCSQLKLQGSHFNIINGYEYSKEACFFCDVTSNSFLIDTHLFKEVLPDFNLSFEMRKLDWFMRLKKLNVWTMTCPDVMIHTSNNVIDRKEFLINRKDFIKSYNDKECYPEYEEHKIKFKELAQKYNLTSVTIQNKYKIKFIFDDY